MKENHMMMQHKKICFVVRLKKCSLLGMAKKTEMFLHNYQENLKTSQDYNF